MPRNVHSATAIKPVPSPTKATELQATDTYEAPFVALGAAVLVCVGVAVGDSESCEALYTTVTLSSVVVPERLTP